MSKIIRLVVVVCVAMFLVACGVKTEDYDKVVANRDELSTKLVSESKTLAKVSKDLETTRRALAAEIKAKQVHTVREEQAKQRLMQAERDLALALHKLAASKGKK